MIKERGPKKEQEEKGYILVMGIILLSSLLLLALPFLSQLSSERRVTEKTFKSLTSMNLAEAGVERAIWELNHGDITTWDGDSSLRTKTITSFQAAGGDVIGDIEINVEDPEGENPVVEATGSVILTGSLTIDKTVRVELKREYVPWDYGVFGHEGIDVSVASDVDSYDSREGLYGGENQGSEGHIGTNATGAYSINLTWFSEVFGNAYSGPESDPEQAIYVSPSSELHGEKLASSEEKKLPSIPPPGGLPFRGEYNLEEDGEDTISESGEYTSFRLDNSSHVTITDDVSLFITGDFDMNMSSKLEIAEGARARIYLGGTFSQGFFTEINNLTKDPTNLLILTTDTFSGNIEIYVASDLYGAVYSPTASVICSFWGNLYGSIVARYISVLVASHIHYDKAFEDLKIAVGSESPCTVKSWQEKISP